MRLYTTPVPLHNKSKCVDAPTRGSQIQWYGVACSRVRPVSYEVNKHFRPRGDGHQPSEVCWHRYRPREFGIWAWYGNLAVICTTSVVAQLHCRDIPACNKSNRKHFARENEALRLSPQYNDRIYWYRDTAIIKMRRSSGPLIFMVGISISVSLYWDVVPICWSNSQ